MPRGLQVKLLLLRFFRPFFCSALPPCPLLCVCCSCPGVYPLQCRRCPSYGCCTSARTTWWTHFHLVRLLTRAIVARPSPPPYPPWSLSFGPGRSSALARVSDLDSHLCVYAHPRRVLFAGQPC